MQYLLMKDFIEIVCIFMCHILLGDTNNPYFVSQIRKLINLQFIRRLAK